MNLGYLDKPAVAHSVELISRTGKLLHGLIAAIKKTKP
jgi:hypothetical protein